MGGIENEKIELSHTTKDWGLATGVEKSIDDQKQITIVHSFLQ